MKPGLQSGRCARGCRNHHNKARQPRIDFCGAGDVGVVECERGDSGASDVRALTLVNCHSVRENWWAVQIQQLLFSVALSPALQC